MPNAPAPKPERAFCSNCGFPVRGGRCDACGTVQEAAPPQDLGDDIPTKQNQFRPYAADLDVGLEGLERVIDAHRAKDLVRFVEQLIAIEGTGTAHSASHADGAAWVATVRGGVVCAMLRLGADELLLESPVCRIPARQRLPALRLALELCGRDAASSRACLRGDLLLLRWSARASQLTPGVLRHYVREIGHLSARYAGLFVIGMDAVPALGDDQKASGGFDLLSRGKKVHLVPGGSIRRSIPPPPQAPAAAPAPARPAPAPARGPAEPRHAGAAGGPSSQAPAEPLEVADAIPAILSPAFSSASQLAIPAVPPPPPVPQLPGAPRTATAPAVHEASALRPPSDASGRAGRGLASPTVPTGAAPLRAGHDAIDAGEPVAPRPAPRPRELDSAISAPPDAKPRVADPRPERPEAGSAPAIPPSDRLCMLLRHAQSLASQTLEERPASLSWLVRSTVFRAIYDFKDTVPDAVAHLYRCIGIGGTGGRTASTQLPATEPALQVMERVIVARAQMPKEKPLALEPMVSAAQAKEHVARYLSEIEKGPQDPGVRHFLALGALTELLVRTKLPPQTDQRLRDIVAHAQREGAKTTAIDLMMTALQRINA